MATIKIRRAGRRLTARREHARQLSAAAKTDAPAITVQPIARQPCRLCENGAIRDPTAAEIIEHRQHRRAQTNANPFGCPIGPVAHLGKLMDPLHLCEDHRQELEDLAAESNTEVSLTFEQCDHAYRLGMTLAEYRREILRAQS